MRTLIEETKQEQVELVDGVKIHLGGDWAAIYPDQDRPHFHILAESGTRATGRADCRNLPRPAQDVVGPAEHNAG